MNRLSVSLLALSLSASVAFAESNTYGVAGLRVIDGDTVAGIVEVWIDTLVRTSIRIEGINAPETKGKCTDEIKAAIRAKARLEELLTGTAVTIRDVKLDKYGGRVDAKLFANDVDAGARLLAEGLVVKYGAKSTWCPEKPPVSQPTPGSDPKSATPPAPTVAPPVTEPKFP